MHKKISKILTVIIAAVMIMMLVSTVMFNVSAQNSGIVERLNILRNTYPAGMYWNHLVTSGIPNGDVLMATNNEVAASLVTSHPCYTHSGSAQNGQYDCNCFDGAIQCFGFANKVFFDVFGVRASVSKIRYDTNNVAVGDWIRVDNDSHSAVVLSRNGNSITVVEANAHDHYLGCPDCNCKIKWDRTISIGTITYFKRASNYDTINNTPVGHNPMGVIDNCVGQEGSVRVTGWAFDMDEPSQSLGIHVYVGGPAGSQTTEGYGGFVADIGREDVNTVYGISGNHGYDLTVKTNKIGSQTVYVYALNVGGGNNALIGHTDVFIKDAKPKMPGDINNDGEVDNKDLTRLFQYLSNWDVTVNKEALDVNGDDSVDNKDLTRLFQYLSNWDVEIF